MVKVTGQRRPQAPKPSSGICSTTAKIIMVLVVVGVVSFTSMMSFTWTDKKLFNDYNQVVKIIDNAMTGHHSESRHETKPDVTTYLPTLQPTMPPVVPTTPLEVTHLLKKKEKGAFDLHFIHIPKCGGTSMTAILREIACHVDPDRNADCCLNPGFCDWHDMKRCASIRGCINHIPQRPWIFKPPPSITIIREPISRILSAWFYRGHSPNNDFFQVRPYFKDIRDGKLPKVKFEEYIEMVEYQNIQTRMLGADSFPYRNVTITEEVFRLATEALDGIFFVGLQEAYDISVRVLLREFQMGDMNITVIKERDQSVAGVATKKKELKQNKALMDRTQEVNSFDVRLYDYGRRKFCNTIRKYPDLLLELEGQGRVRC